MTHGNFVEAPSTEGGAQTRILVSEFMDLFTASVRAPDSKWAAEAERIQTQFRVCRKWAPPLMGQVVAFDRREAVHAAFAGREVEG